MREVWPDQSDSVDIVERLSADSRPAQSGRPWVTMVMVSSLDGGIAVDGVSGGLGNQADQQRFIALRRSADAIVVGSRTAMVENYQPTVTPIAIISGRLSLDPGALIFSDPARKPLVFTTDQSARTRGQEFDGIAEVIALGDSVDPGEVLAVLASRGSEHVALEGGPTLNGLFLEADVVDEVLLTVAPTIVSGTSSRLAHGADPGLNQKYSLDRLLIDGNHVFMRYLRAD